MDYKTVRTELVEWCGCRSTSSPRTTSFYCALVIDAVQGDDPAQNFKILAYLDLVISGGKIVVNHFEKKH